MSPPSHSLRSTDQLIQDAPPGGQKRETERRWSLRRRIILAVTGIVIASWIVSQIAAAMVMSEETDEVFDSALRQTAERLLPLAIAGLAIGETSSPVFANDHPRRELAYVIFDRDGVIVFHSDNAYLSVFQGLKKPGFHRAPMDHIYLSPLSPQGYAIAVAEPVKMRREATRETLVALALPTLIFLPGLILAAYWVTGRILTPLAKLQKDLDSRDIRRLEPVYNTGLPIELNGMVHALNTLLLRFRHSLEAERSFTANAAHELRTPLAAALAQTQQVRLADPKRNADLVRIEQPLRRLSRLSEKLLHLARAEGGGVLAPEPVDLLPILYMVVEDFERSGYGGRLDVTLPATVPPSHLDADVFSILARNLIQNALIHSPAGSMVQIAMTGDGILSVRNDGPVLPPERLAALTRRFVRGGGAAEGAGLGLAIVEAIAASSGSRLELLSPIPGRTRGMEVLFRPTD
ncbi:MAG: histidine kinase dimerization/phospho-acceptor domain-containing protein [Rhodospirillaceae bacterium]|nr:histidine kinase dimerization/phospho-acceptor domain-containing protein [Rhodospirillaceae bacterium]